MRGFLAFVVAALLSAPCVSQEQDRGMVAPYVRYGSPTARYSTNPPKVYSGGRYMGELSENRYRPDSISNPYGTYGSRYSPSSLNNPYRRYSTQPIYIYQSW